MVETQQSLAQTGISTFLSFGAKSVKPEILEKLLIGRQKTVDMLTQQATDIAEHGINAQLMLIGNRGMGKTHVLRVLYHRIQPLVQSRKIVVAYFVEEAYDVASYLDFLVRIIKDFIRWYAQMRNCCSKNFRFYAKPPRFDRKNWRSKSWLITWLINLC